MTELKWQVYKDFYGKVKIKRLRVCAEPQWISVHSKFIYALIRWVKEVRR